MIIKKILRTLTSTLLILILPMFMAVIVLDAIHQDVIIYPIEQAIIAVAGISISMLCLWLID